MAQANTIEISSNNLAEGKTVSNLTIVMADPSDAGGYVCLATNPAGQDNATAQLTVHGKSLIFTTEHCDPRLLTFIICSAPVIPSITFPLDDGFRYTVNETDPVIFTCSATGIPPPEITWMKNGMPLSNTRVTITDPTMPELYSTDGGNIFLVSRNLSLDNAMSTDSGTYTCVVSNGNIVQQTQNFDLFVNGMSMHDEQVI